VSRTGDTSTTAQSVPPTLRISGVSKSFGPTRALTSVSLEVRPGEIHALLGGNGSGKSTLIKVLAGVHSADSGQLSMGGVTVDASQMNPALARNLGLRFVHQQRSTFEHLSVLDNLFMDGGFQTQPGWRIPWRGLRRQATQILERFGIDADPDTELGTLNAANQTMVAIARALYAQKENAGVLVLDEPTASLPAAEVDLLLNALRRLTSNGHAILFVTHRLEEVLEVSDTITVLRDGELVDTVRRSSIDHDRLVELILGRKLSALAKRNAPDGGGRELLRVTDLRGGPVQGASFSVRSGEIVGLAGLIGSGRTSLLQMLFGVRKPVSGEIVFKDQRVSFTSLTAAMTAGLGYVPEDRAGDAAFPDLSVAHNMSMSVVGSYFVRGALRRRRESEETRRLAGEFLVKAEGPTALMSSLSGGNQQKVILARWLRRNPSLLLLDEPTQGVDVGARFEIWELIRRSVERDTGVLVVSSDYEELAAACDRVLVVKRGRIFAEVSGEELTDSHIEHLTLESA
jgi:ribose transport system ATP-binding protein